MERIDMCSIFGSFKLKSDAACVAYFASECMQLMRHRGPDSESVVILDSKCTLGHQRLSIIDVKEQANQPMRSSNWSIVYNGEIYNYKELKKNMLESGIEFQTTSDTEVLFKGLQQDGTAFLKKTNGMFAFALYDAFSQRLILARDRFGVKPLHYMIQNDVLYFASEIKPLIRIKKNISRNLSVYRNYFDHLATDYDESTFICDIFQLKKGHYLSVQSGSWTEHQWYCGNDFTFDEAVFDSTDSTLEFLEELLADAVNIRLRADVPVCLTLSGGIDSTVIYTLIKEKLQRDIQPFTFMHPGAKTDEFKKVSGLIDKYGDTVRQVKSSHTDNFENIREDLVKVEFPIWGISTRAYSDMYQTIRHEGYTVVLEGHGSDEQLGGYEYMIDFAIYDYLKQGNWPKAYQTLFIRQRTANAHLTKQVPQQFSNRRILEAKNRDKHQFVSFQDIINWTVDFKILPIVLRAFDRLSMSASIESRSPYMDYRVVEFFKKLPLRHKVSGLGNKAILREILKKYGQKTIYRDKAKMGFASDVPDFFSRTDNQNAARNYVNQFSIPMFEKYKDAARDALSQAQLQWSNIGNVQKVSLIAMIDELYSLDE